MKESSARRELLMVVLAAAVGVLVAFLNVAAHAPQVFTIIVGAVATTLIGARLSRYPLASPLIYVVVAAATNSLLSHG